MTKFVLTYAGGEGMPESADEQKALMEAWGDWFASLGDALVDGGAPFAETVSLTPDGSATAIPHAAAPTGYSIIAADSIDVALQLARSCPVLAGGATVNVSVALDL